MIFSFSYKFSIYIELQFIQEKSFVEIIWGVYLTNRFSNTFEVDPILS